MTDLEAFKEKYLVLEVDENFENYKFIQDLVGECVPVLNEKYIEYVKTHPEYKFLTVEKVSAFYPNYKYEYKVILKKNYDTENCGIMKAQDFVKEYCVPLDVLNDFVNGKLVLEVDEDMKPIDALQELVEQNTGVRDLYKAGSKGCAKELANKAIVKYGIGNACISFNSGAFGWCSKQWYIDEGYRVMHIRDFIAQYYEPDTNAEDEWEKLYKEYTGENNE